MPESDEGLSQPTHNADLTASRSPAQTAEADTPTEVESPFRTRPEPPLIGDDDEDTDFGSTSDLGTRSWFYVIRKTVREFLDDQGTDLAAALTYYAVLAVFPALLAVFSLLGVVANPEKALQKALEILRPLVSGGTLDKVRPTLENLAHSQGASLAVLLGGLAALYSASAYVGAFGRALNRMYEVDEGRPIWKLLPMQILVTVINVVLSAVALLILIVSGPVATSVGKVLGVGSNLVTIWNIAKWPVLAIVVTLAVATLYHFTPNVRPAKFRYLSVGSFVAILVWLVASAGFAFYVANFSSYDKTYGSVAGVVIALLWLWLTNVALLFGAELDAELERARELHAGLPAEEWIQLPVRDARGIEKAHDRRVKDIDNGRSIRESRTGSGDPEDRPFQR